MNKSFRIGNRLWEPVQPVIMGILNVTPDSFFKGSRTMEIEEAVAKAGQLLAEGASIIDIGGYSTRPGAGEVAITEERNRVLPVIEGIREHYPEALISIDTFRAEVAGAAVQAGASFINDISGGNFDPEIWNIAAEQQVPYILMHIQGTPADMQENPTYENVVTEVARYFSEKIAALTDIGVADIILDPGFGFGKTLTHNYRLLARAEVFQLFDRPLLAGMSRKSMVNQVLGTRADEALNGTTVLHTLALQKGFSILRVHDVKAALESVQIMKKFREADRELTTFG